MIAVDTNILVHAHRADSPHHERAGGGLRSLAEAASPWAIPWPCIHEFLAIVTHPRIYKPPTPLETALTQIDCWFESPSLILLGESALHWQTLRAQIAASTCVGPMIHDARVAAICIQHGVETLWTADRDFSKFPGLKTHNPLVQTADR